MPRIIVVGPSAAGKSTFSRQLAAKLQIPVIDLDAEFSQMRQGVDIRKVLNDIDLKLNQPDWIMDGLYPAFVHNFTRYATGMVVYQASAWQRARGHAKRLWTGKHLSSTQEMDSLKWLTIIGSWMMWALVFGPMLHRQLRHYPDMQLTYVTRRTVSQVMQQSFA